MRGVYYRHSGKFSAPRLALVFAVGLVTALVLAIVYAYSFAYIPIIGYVSFLLAMGFGSAVGFVVSRMAMSVGHVRSPVATMLVTVLAMGIGYYLSWAVWLHAIAGRGDINIPIGEIVTSPKLMWSLITALNESGVWSMHGFTPQGGILWLFWGLEIAFIFVPAVWVAKTGLGSSAYCESCGHWCVDGLSMDHGIADIALVASQLEAGEVHALGELPPRGPEDTVWTRVSVKVCPTQGCGQTNTLSVSTVTFEFDDNGNAKEKAELFIDRLLIDRANAKQLGG